MNALTAIIGINDEPHRETYEPYRFSMTPEFVLSYPVEKINDRNLHVIMRALGSLDDKDETTKLRLNEVINEIDRRLKLNEYVDMDEIKKDFRLKFFIFSVVVLSVMIVLLAPR